MNENPDVGQIERKTQNRIVTLFQENLNYTYLGNWEERENNSNIEEELLLKFLKKQKYSESLIHKAIFELNKIASTQNKSLYDINKEVYTLLRYGIQVRDTVGQNKNTVWLIDWNNIKNNDFYIAEEVTVKGEHNKRPDIVLYVNGIALAVLELKRSTISVSEGIRQNLDNQKKEFIQSFFSTIQLIFAGNDSEGAKYGLIGTPEKYYLSWKEKSDIRNRLDKQLIQMCNKERFLEIIHDFIVFDAGIKKMCRHNQYFGVKESQKYIIKKEGGIIWHTQGSGKSLTMIWLAKWIKENIDNSRVLIITDREELDGQIENFFIGVEEKIYRTKSGRDLLNKLSEANPSLICSLVHKFGSQTNKKEDYFEELSKSLPSDFKPKGNLYVFVDECHRTQSGKLNEAMKRLLPQAIFIGFTGTPLLKKDKKQSREVFGEYIHTYKFDEAVNDGVILDLQYEARNIDQKLTSQSKVDEWFELKTKGLTNFAKAVLKKKWGTIQKVLSSQSRLSKVVADILLDMEKKDRLQSGRGNSILIAGSISEACKYYELFQKGGLKKCAIVTSYSANISSIKGETVSEEEETENLQKYETYQKMLDGKDVDAFEKEVKKKFIEEPAQMKLLIVVDKLLTGFDAPPATYLYIDKNMQDHGLFQAICRVNRLDGEDKDYGYIVDYKDLFNSLNKAVQNYTTGAFGGFDKEDVGGLLKNRLKVGRDNLDSSLESIRTLCEPVKPPKDTVSFIEFFCGNPENTDDLKKSEQQRIMLYKLSSKLIRAYSNIAGEMAEAGYSKKEFEKIQAEVKYYEQVRMEIKLASGDYVDLKAYEPAMRHLIDSYIDAEDSKTISAFDNLTLIDLIVKNGKGAIKVLPPNIRKNNRAIAEVIENNVRKLIVEETPKNPKYFKDMSVLLNELIDERNKKAVDYAKYLEKIINFVKQVKDPFKSHSYSKELNTFAKRALYDNLGKNENLVLTLHNNIIEYKPDGWRGNKLKEKKIKNIIKQALAEHKIKDDSEVEKVLELVKNQDEY